MQNSRAGVVFARALPHRGVERLPRRPIDAKQSDYSGGRGDYAGEGEKGRQTISLQLQKYHHELPRTTREALGSPLPAFV